MERKVEFRRITLKPIDSGRWNDILGEDKTTYHKSIPQECVSAIWTNKRLRAVSFLNNEIADDHETYWDMFYEAFYE
jgi:hypothetical protein